MPRSSSRLASSHGRTWTKRSNKATEHRIGPRWWSGLPLFVACVKACAAFPLTISSGCIQPNLKSDAIKREHFINTKCNVTCGNKFHYRNYDGADVLDPPGGRGQKRPPMDGGSGKSSYRRNICCELSNQYSVLGGDVKLWSQPHAGVGEHG